MKMTVFTLIGIVILFTALGQIQQAPPFNSENDRRIIMQGLRQRCNWEKLAVAPESWVNKEVSFHGWLYYKTLDPSNVGEVNIFKSKEAMEFQIPLTSIVISSEDATTACGDNARIILQKLDGKFVFVRGTLDFPLQESFALGTLKNATIEVNRNQPIDGIPERLLGLKVENLK